MLQVGKYYWFISEEGEVFQGRFISESNPGHSICLWVRGIPHGLVMFTTDVFPTEEDARTELGYRKRKLCPAETETENKE